MVDLKRLRDEKNFTQCQVSQESDISLSFYCQIESGKRRPSIEVSKRIAKVFGINWYEIFEK